MAEIAADLADHVFPPAPTVESAGLVAAEGDKSDDSHRLPRSPARYLWATLIARLFEIFPLTCRDCGAEMKIITFVTATPSVRAILAAHFLVNERNRRRRRLLHPPLPDEPQPFPRTRRSRVMFPSSAPTSLLCACSQPSSDGIVTAVPAVVRLNFLSFFDREPRAANLQYRQNKPLLQPSRTRAYECTRYRPIFA